MGSEFICNSKERSTVMESLQIYVVDAFSTEAFRGNPAAVCLVSKKSKVYNNENLMKKIAFEMNLSETAYVITDDDEESFTTGDSFSLRWFTPTTEVNLCGHATLATAVVLFNKLSNRNPCIKFETLSGVLPVTRNGDLVTLNFPLNPSVKQEPALYKALLKEVVHESLIQDVEFSPATKKLLVRLIDIVTRDQLSCIAVGIPSLPKLDASGNVKGVILTVKGTKENGCVDSNGEPFDFVSRYFAPWVGIPEDPVTGSAHTVLASYWSKQLNKHALYAQQCSARGGELRLEVKKERVDISGYGTITLEGHFHV